MGVNQIPKRLLELVRVTAKDEQVCRESERARKVRVGQCYSEEEIWFIQ